MPKSNSQQLLDLILSYAPTNKANETAQKYYDNMKADGATEEQLTKSMNSALYDGLNFGNWPWITPGGK